MAINYEADKQMEAILLPFVCQMTKGILQFSMFLRFLEYS